MSDLIARGIAKKVEAQLADTAKKVEKVIYTSNIGMTPEDTDNSNFSKLCVALDTGYKIIVDNAYKLNVTTPYPLYRDIDIKGLSHGCGFDVINSSTHMFSINSSVSIKMYDLSFSGKTNTIFYNAILTSFIREVDVRYCNFNGQTSLMYFNIANNDFDLKHGFGDLTFKYNHLNNISLKDVGYMVGGFISIPNAPFKSITFDDNKVYNFTHNVLFLGITNEYTDTPTLAKNRDVINLYRNKVVNDDTWFDEDRGVSQYHTFCLAENKTMNYKENHVEGLKSLTGKAVYDIYASCQNLYSENNYWKNNLSFNLLWGGALNNCLMKFKGGSSSNRAYRLINHNTYVIDEDFASRVGKEDKWMFVDLYNTTAFDIDLEIIDNDVNVPYLSMGGTSVTSLIYKFKNNTIKTRRTMGSFARLGGLTSWKDTPNKAIFEISGNKVYSKEINDAMFDEFSPFSNDFALMFHAYSSLTGIPRLGSLVFNNNIVHADFKSTLFSPSRYAMFEYIKSNSINFSDNTFVDINETTTTDSIKEIFYATEFNYLFSKNNVFENLDVNGGYNYQEAAKTDVKKVILSNYVHVRKNAGTLMGIPIKDFINGVSDRKLRFNAKYKIIKPDLSEIEISFKFTMENGKFIYRKVDGTTTEKVLTGATTPSTTIIDQSSGLLKIALLDNLANSWSTAVSISLVTGQTLDNCDVYTTVEINTDKL